MSRSARGRKRFVRILATLATAGAMLPLAAASAGAATTGTSAAGRAQAGAGNVAPGAPGSMSYFDLARKDCVGTATGTA
jgi:glucoamylase